MGSAGTSSNVLRPLPSHRESRLSAALHLSRRLVNSARASFCASGAKPFAASRVFSTFCRQLPIRSRTFIAFSSVFASSTATSTCVTNSIAVGSFSSMILASRSSAPSRSHLPSCSCTRPISFIALPKEESRRSSRRPSSASVSPEAFCFFAALPCLETEPLASSISSTRACSNWLTARTPSSKMSPSESSMDFEVSTALSTFDSNRVTTSFTFLSRSSSGISASSSWPLRITDTSLRGPSAGILQPLMGGIAEC
mmetsp:Transcript_78902/g.152362  ORF Transcript_78902/g.152362 Transcript_78902/m.152362 type:complete len:255 (-) Transcript_78902:457-1221(-)